jgi:hypothetical protein
MGAYPQKKITILKTKLEIVPTNTFCASKESLLKKIVFDNLNFPYK